MFTFVGKIVASLVLLGVFLVCGLFAWGSMFPGRYDHVSYVTAAISGLISLSCGAGVYWLWRRASQASLTGSVPQRDVSTANIDDVAFERWLIANGYDGVNLSPDDMLALRTQYARQIAS